MSDSDDGKAGDRCSSVRTTSAVSRRRLLASVTATAVGTGGIAPRVAARSTVAVGGAAGVSQSDESVGVRDEVWVETSLDTNDSGTNDRIYVAVTRPESTTDGGRVPVIATATPYNGEHDHGDTTDEMLYDRAMELSASGDAGTTGAAERRATGIATGGDSTGPDVEPRHDPAVGREGRSRSELSRRSRLERRYVQDGYAVASVSSLGTHRSTGCYTAAGPETAEALAAVVDWFNGRATAYDAKRGDDTVAADWTNGTTGMIGTSANGELANAVATTGVDGLEAIVPNSANNGQYGLFRSNGTPVSVVPTTDERIADLSSWVRATHVERPNCDHWADRVAGRQDHATGDYNDFWHEREFLPKAESVDAAVLLSHTVDDPIVKPNNFADWYRALDDADVPLRLWLHKGGHRSPEGQAWTDLVDRWWEYWLKGVDNGVVDEDPVSVVHDGGSAEYGRLDTYSTWPVPDAEATTVGFAPDGTTVGDVTLTESDANATRETFVDDPSVRAEELAYSEASDHRLRYETPPLEKRVHVSGNVVPTLSLSFDDPTVVSVALAEHGPSTEIVARGWADPLNRPRYGDYDSPVAYRESLRESSPITTDEQVQIEFPLQATDHVFEEGSRIGLVVYASDSQFTLHPPGNSTVTLSLSESEVALPVAGGRAALGDAFAEENTDETTRTDAETPGSTTDTETTDGGSPGFGLGSAATVVGGVGYLLARLRSREEPEAEE